MAQVAGIILASHQARIGRKQAKEAKVTQGVQEEEIKRQKQLESAALAEEESEIGRRRLTAITGGRRSLIRTSEIGTAARKTLG